MYTSFNSFKKSSKAAFDLLKQNPKLKLGQFREALIDSSPFISVESYQDSFVDFNIDNILAPLQGKQKITLETLKNEVDKLKESDKTTRIAGFEKICADSVKRWFGNVCYEDNIEPTHWNEEHHICSFIVSEMNLFRSIPSSKAYSLEYYALLNFGLPEVFISRSSSGSLFNEYSPTYRLRIAFAKYMNVHYAAIYKEMKERNIPVNFASFIRHAEQTPFYKISHKYDGHIPHDFNFVYQEMLKIEKSMDMVKKVKINRSSDKTVITYA